MNTFGDEITSTANDREKFETYQRDSYTGLDYADQRMYGSTYGRFMTPDLHAAGAATSGNTSNPSDPGSWNLYAFGGGDPVNRLDPTGLDWIWIPDQGLCSTLDPFGGCYDPGSDDGYECGIQADQFNPAAAAWCMSASAQAATLAAQEAAFLAAAALLAQQSSSTPTCASTETAWVSSYLSSRGSPLAGYAGSIVAQSDSAGVDDRFIVALAGAESTYGKNTSATWGQYNAWSDSQHCAVLSGDCQSVNPFPNFSQAITAVIGNITGTNYFGANPALTTTSSIYEKYSAGGSPALLNTIYLNQMGGGLIPGNPEQVDFSRCTN